MRPDPVERWREKCGTKREVYYRPGESDYVRRPICNRIRLHPGLHQERDRESFKVLAEWGDLEAHYEKPKRWAKK